MHFPLPFPGLLYHSLVYMVPLQSTEGGVTDL